ncbi:Restriction endonuclease fold toxin 7 [Arthrobacter alpinus]|uniref:Restriction endonuclease fold toxin 7 n=1 Tax=Arthrobacter alpinus TaxID=656366 RepID=A0A1H5PFD8_9MICC|nr:putative toxin [Arthrobacter alpinus]SEF11781.1 Restriction endonuclease fold toxin 7 [Arthrobacter alpinus]
MVFSIRRALRAYLVATSVVALLVVALVAGMLSGAEPSAAVSGPSSSDASLPLSPAVDAAGVVRLWKSGGETTREAAKAALQGGPEQIQAFIAGGQHDSLNQDYRLMTLKLTLFGGKTVRTKAQEALDTNTDTSLREFVATGWKQAWLTDDRLETYQFLNTGTPQVKKAAQKALNAGTEAAVQDFILTGQEVASTTDNRMSAYQLQASGSPSVQTAAAAALNSSTPNAVQDFLRYGQFVAASHDIETATISQLAAQAKSASDLSTTQMALAQKSADQAVDAARMAKQATARAAQEAAAAKASAAKAGAAASRAASLADQAALAADIAVNAAQAAHEAMLAAANAAANAAAATARANNAAAAAQNSAAAAASDASQAAAAKAAAVQARDAATNAKKAVDAVAAAITAVEQSLIAANSASSAGGHSQAAAASAMAASNEAGVSAEQAAHARAAAGRAAAAADRAEQATQRVIALANETKTVAEEARKAASEAITHANNAAAAADDAAAHAGVAATAAAKSQQAATAAKSAADAASAAVAQAKTVEATARKVDAARLTAEKDFGIKRAQAAADIEATRLHEEKMRAQAATTAAAQTDSLVTKLTTPGADLDQLIPEARIALVGLMQVGGPWVQAGAQNAITGTNEQIKEYFTEGRSVAVEQDEWDEALTYVASDNADISYAAEEAMETSPEDITEFLTTGHQAIENPIQRQAAYKIMVEGGTEAKKAAEVSLASTDQAAVSIFLDEGYDAAQRLDDRITAYQLLATGSPEVKVAAEVALNGPRDDVRRFVQSGRYDAEDRDYQTAAHVSAVTSMIAGAAKNAATAQANAATAAQAAAKARNAATEAQKYAQQATGFANTAASAGTEAKNHADAATASANQAAQSAATAQQAATQARSDANLAQNHAANAAQSAAMAASAAAIANTAAAQASASAAQAGLDAAEAAEAATVATQAATTLQQEEDRAARLTKKLMNLSGIVSSEELDAANLAGGAAATQELKDARSVLGQGSILDFIIKEGGQLLLDFFGVTDVINCFTKGDIAACAMALISALPIGKIFKAGKVLGMIGKLVPKALEFVAKNKWARTVVEKYSATATSCVVGVAAKLASFNNSQSPTRAVITAGYSGSKTLKVNPANALRAAAGDKTCPLQPKNPASYVDSLGKALKDSAGKRIYTVGYLGRWAEQVVGLSTAGKPYLQIPNKNGIGFHFRVPDGVDANNLIDVKNVKKLYLTRQLEDFLAYAQSNKIDGNPGKLILYVGAHTEILGKIQEKIDKGVIVIRRLPADLANPGDWATPVFRPGVFP